MKKGLTLLDICVVVAIIGTLFVLLLPVINHKIETSREIRCRGNLTQIGKALQVYFNLFGRERLYPDTNGGGFLARVYQLGILSEIKWYVCPSTVDETDAKTLMSLTAEDSDAINGTSYAGRKNANPTVYPGLWSWGDMRIGSPGKNGQRFESGTDNFVPTLASDDFQGTPNHNNGKAVNVLFLSCQVREIVNPNACPNDYTSYAGPSYDSSGKCISPAPSLNPLTN